MDTDTLERVEVDVDLDLEPPCQHRLHRVEHGDAPVVYLVKVRCPDCEQVTQTLQCHVGVEQVLACGVAYRKDCGHRWHIVEHPGSYVFIPI